MKWPESQPGLRDSISDDAAFHKKARDTAQAPVCRGGTEKVAQFQVVRPVVAKHS